MDFPPAPEDPALLIALLHDHYRADPPDAIQRIPKGAENQHFLLTWGDTKCVLRVYSANHSTTGARRAAEIAFEIAWIDHLRRAGVRVPAVLPTRHGGQYATVHLQGQPRFVVLFAYAHGDEASAYTHEKALSTAQTLLQIRIATARFHMPNPRRWPGDFFGACLQFYQSQRQHTAPYQGFLDDLMRTAAADYHYLQALPTGILHGDIKLENLLFQGSQVSAVLDFDDYRSGYCIEEQVRTLMHDLDSPTRNPIRAGYWCEFTGTFARNTRIPAQEAMRLPAFLRARLLYDLTTYLLNGNAHLVEEIIEDAAIRAVILAPA